MGIWGKNLTAIFMQTKRAVPRFLEQCMSFIIDNHIDTEGIFRVPGDIKRKTAIKDYADATDQLDETLISGPYEICNTITHFIREIPDSIMISSNLSVVQEIYDVDDAKDFVSSLYFINRVLLSRIFAFFHLVTQHPSNRMGSSNIAIILSPILIIDPKNPLYMLPKETVEIFINNYSEIFSTVPALTPDGNWMPSDEFERSLGDLTERFFCQSTYMQPNLMLDEIIEKKDVSDQICRRILVKELDIDHLLKHLLCSDRERKVLSEHTLEEL